MVLCSLVLGCLAAGGQASDFQFYYAVERMSRARQVMRKYGLYTPAWFTSDHLMNPNGYGVTAASDGESVTFSIGNNMTGFLGPYLRTRYREGDPNSFDNGLYPYLGGSSGIHIWTEYQTNASKEQKVRTVSKDEWKIAEAELSRLYAGFDLQEVEAQYSIYSLPRIDFAEAAKHISIGPDFLEKVAQYVLVPPLVVAMRAELAIDGVPVVALRRYMSAAGPPFVQQANLFTVSVSVESITRDLMYASHIGLNIEPETTPVETSIEKAEEFIKKALKNPGAMRFSPLDLYLKINDTSTLVALERVGDVYLLRQSGEWLSAQRALSAVATVVSTVSDEDMVVKFRFIFTGYVYSRLVILGAPWKEEASQPPVPDSSTATKTIKPFCRELNCSIPMGH